MTKTKSIRKTTHNGNCL